jgi:hypothetical protein
MAIKERKQITGTEAQIKGYAGHNGVLAYATDTKHLHVLSGTAGTTTKLANVSDIPAPVDISGKADKTYVDTELAKKQAKGDYATNTALTQGLAGKANTSHTHTIANVTGLQDVLNATSTQASNAIPKNGNRGAIAGYELWSETGATTTISISSGDATLLEAAGAGATINMQAGPVGQVATKLVWVSRSNKSVTFTGDVYWFGGDAPTINKTHVVLLFLFHDGFVDCKLLGQWD